MKYLLTFFLGLGLQVTYTQSISEKIDTYVSSYVQTRDFSGCVTVSKEGSVIYENCFGQANYAFNIDNVPQTKFKIGSIAKQFTAAGILKLEEQGLLRTTDRIDRYFPDHPNAQNISIEQLLNHTSGVVDIFNLPEFSSLSCKKVGLADLTQMILNEELLFAPGEQYQYSNGGYAILAQIIEQVGQKPYGDFMNQTIFEPLEMNSTGHHKNNDIIKNLAVGYDPLGFRDLILTDYIENDLLKGSGSLYSTASDLLKWIDILKNQTFLSEASFRKLFKNYENNYGYGISVYNSFGQEVFGHDGRINGYIADYLHYKEEDVSIIILGNVQTGVADFFRRDIGAIIFNEYYQSRAKTMIHLKAYPPNEDEILGSYSFGPNFTVYIEKIDGLVKARANEGGYSELVPLKNGKYFSRMLYSFIEFKTDGKGRSEKMIWINNDGNQFEGVKN